MFDPVKHILRQIRDLRSDQVWVLFDELGRTDLGNDPTLRTVLNHFRDRMAKNKKKLEGPISSDQDLVRIRIRQEVGLRRRRGGQPLLPKTAATLETALMMHWDGNSRPAIQKALAPKASPRSIERLLNKHNLTDFANQLRRRD